MGATPRELERGSATPLDMDEASVDLQRRLSFGGVGAPITLITPDTR